MVKEDPKLTRLEMEVMGAVWTLSAASVREIREALPERKRPAYTTVQTIIYRLEEKGAVRRVKKVGNALIFEAAVTRKAAHRRLIDELLRVFGGSPRLLMAQLVETGQLTLEDLRDLENRLQREARNETLDEKSTRSGKRTRLKQRSGRQAK